MSRKHSNDWPWSAPAGEPGEKRNRTYQLPVELIAQVQATSKALGCYPSHLVEVLIGHGLSEMAAGRLVVEKQPIMFSLRLKPGEGVARSD